MNKFKVGDKVKLLNIDKKRYGRLPGYDQQMIDNIGKIGTIINIYMGGIKKSNKWIRINFNNGRSYIYLPESLQKISDKKDLYVKKNKAVRV